MRYFHVTPIPIPNSKFPTSFAISKSKEAVRLAVIPVAPQLWGNENEAEKNNYLAGGNNYLGFPSGRLLGEVPIENRAYGV